METVPATSVDHEQPWRTRLTRYRRETALAAGGWLATAGVMALLWHPVPPGAWAERLGVALTVTALLLAGTLRLLVWLRLACGQSAARTSLVALLLLALGAMVLTAGGGAMMAALTDSLSRVALSLLALSGLALAAGLVATTVPDLERMLAAEPPAPVHDLEASDAVAVPVPGAQPLMPAAGSAATLEPARLDRPAASWPRVAIGEREALAVVIGLALLLRLVALGSFPASMTTDEADNLQVIYRILNGRGPGLFGFDWKPMPAFSLHLMTPAVWLSGLSLTGLRLTSALLSTLALLPLYLVARRAMSMGAALTATALLGSSLWYLHFSRSGWENVHVCLYAVALMWLLGRAVDEGRWRYYAAAGGALALGMYGYFAGWSLPLAVVASLPLAIIVQRAAWRRILAGYGLTLVVALLLYVPQLISFSQDWSVLTGGRVGTVAMTDTAQPDRAGIELPMFVLGQVERTVRAFLLMDPTYNTTGLNQRYLAPGWSFLDPVTAALYIVGLLLAIRRWRTTWLWWPMLLVPLAVTQVLAAGAPDGARGLIVAPVMLLFAGLGLDWLVDQRRWRHPAWVSGITLAVVAVMLFNVASYIRWQTSPEAARSRQPSVEGDEFDLWRERQWAAIQAGQWGFSVSEWQATRPMRFGNAAPAVQAGPLQGAIVRARQVTMLVGPGTAGGVVLDDARDVAVDSSGIWVVEAGRQQVSHFSADGRLLARWGRSGSGPGEFIEPVALVIDEAGAVHVLDADRGLVQVFSADGQARAEYGRELGLYRPRDLTLGSDGLLYIADTGRNRVVRLEPDGTLRDILPGEAAASRLQFNQPTAAIAVDGILYVAEPDQGQMQAIGAGAQGASTVWNLTRTDTMHSMRLVRGPKQEVVITDVGNQQVVLICPGSREVLAWPATGTEIGRLAAAALGPDGSLYVADRAGRLVVVQLERGCA